MTPDTSPRRWHANADPQLRDSLDTIAAHQARVATLCHSLAAAMGHALTDSDLIPWALKHDQAEIIMGDWPAELTRRYWFARFAKRVIEWMVLRDMGIKRPRLTRREKNMLHLCDRLDAYCHAHALGCTDTGPWRKGLARLHRRAHTLGPAAVAWLEGAIG